MKDLKGKMNFCIFDILNSLMRVLSQACYVVGQSTALDHQDLLVYEEAFEMLIELGLMKKREDELYELNWEAFEILRKKENAGEGKPSYFKLADGTSWPASLKIFEQLEWKLRYAREHITDSDCLMAASVLHAYFWLIHNKTQKSRNWICEQIKKYNES